MNNNTLMCASLPVEYSERSFNALLLILMGTALYTGLCVFGLTECAMCVQASACGSLSSEDGLDPRVQ